MKRKSGFTLVEMLIVVVIIGILSAALIPRLTGYMARTRDLKRQTDLRNIAVAVQRYKDDHGELPRRHQNTWLEDSMTTLQASPCFPYGTMESVLQEYMFPLPRDPQSNSMIDLHKEVWIKSPYNYGKPIAGDSVDNLCDKYGPNIPRLKAGVMINPGQYLYQIFRKGGDSLGAAILVAKVETPDIANYVRFKSFESLQGGFLKRNYRGEEGGYVFGDPKITQDIDDLHLCTSMEKVLQGNEKFEIKESEGKVNCTYSSEDQLYYIVKIE